METLWAAVASPSDALRTDTRLGVFPGADLEMVRTSRDDRLIQTGAEYALQQRVYVVLGLFLRDEQLRLCLMDDTDRLVLEQPAAHLNPAWAGNLRRASEWTVVETPFG